MGKGTAGPCIGTICYPSTSNMGLDKGDGSEERVENNIPPTPAPSADNILQDSPDWPAPVRCSTWTTRNQLPWRYQKFQVVNRYQANWHLECMGLPVCLFAYSSLSVHHFLERCSVEHTLLIAKYAPLNTTHSSIQGNSLDVTPKVDSWVGKGVDQRTFGTIATPLPV